MSWAVTVRGVHRSESERGETHLEIFVFQLFTPPDEESAANVEVELREGVCTFRLTQESCQGMNLYEWRDRCTRYVSHIRMVFCTLISRINRQFIQRNANCMNSTFCDSRCDDSDAAQRLNFVQNIRTRLTIYASNKFLHSLHTPVDTRLG